MVGEVVLIVIFGLATRSIFLTTLQSDFSSHLWHVERFVRDPRIGSLDVHNGLFSGTTGNPPLPSYLYAFLPRRWRVSVGLFANLFFDVVTGLFLYAVLSILPLSKSLIEVSMLSPACMGALLFLSTPLLHPFSARLRGAGSRTLGTLLSTVYFVLLGVLINDAGPIELLVPLLLIVGSVIVLSTKFTLQVFVFVSLCLSVLQASLWPVGLVGATVLLLCMVPSLNIRQYLKNRLSHFSWYRKAIKHETMSQNLTTVYRGRWSVLLEIPSRLKKNFLSGLRFTLTHVSLAAVIVGLPVLDWLFLDALQNSAQTYGPGEMYAWKVIVSCLVVTVVTSIRPFIIFGESERYMEASIPFAVYLLLGVVPAAEVESLWLLLLINVCLILGTFVLMNRDTITKKIYPKQGKSFRELAEFLETLEPWRRIITTPQKLATALDVNLSVPHLYYFHLYLAGKGFDAMYNYWHNYFMFNLDFAKAKQELGANMFILEKGFMARYKDMGYADVFERLDTIYSNEKYVVFVL